MSLSNIALAGCIVAGVLYSFAVILGMISMWPYGLIGLLVIAFVGFIFLTVVSQRLNNKEDDYYEKNIKD